MKTDKAIYISHNSFVSKEGKNYYQVSFALPDTGSKNSNHDFLIANTSFVDEASYIDVVSMKLKPFSNFTVAYVKDNSFHPQLVSVYKEG